MIAYVESNFILELAYAQLEAYNCKLLVHFDDGYGYMRSKVWPSA